MPRSIIRTITTAIAIAALAAPTALARPADTPPVGYKATAAVQKQDARSGAIDGYSQRPMNDRPLGPPTGRPHVTAKPTPEVTPKPVADHGVAWTTIGLGIAGSLLAVGAIAAMTMRTRRTGIAA
jgi:hypothetical protein